MLVEQAHDRGREHGADARRREEQERDLARPEGTSARNPGPSRAAARLERAGNSTAATATENMPCGSM